MDRKCEGCRWSSLVWYGRILERQELLICENQNEHFARASTARARGNCGPSGRYWEPRAEEE